MSCRNVFVLTFGVSLVVCGFGTAHAQCPNQQLELLASDGAFDDEFGWSIAVSGSVLIVGAPLDDTAGQDAGAAYVFRHEAGTWVQEQQLLAPDAAYEDRFGWAVAIEGNVAIITAPFNDSAGGDAGAAYVFTYIGGSWVYEARLTASDAGFEDHFGSAVSLHADMAVIGAADDDTAGHDAGAAYVFSGWYGFWFEEQQLLASDAAFEDHFGFAVSTHGGTVVVGSPDDDSAGENAGAAYVYRYGGGGLGEEQQLLASDAAFADHFGFSVSMGGDLIVVGVWTDDSAAQNGGAAYVYRFDGNSWLEEQQLTASDAAFEDNFGYSVATSGAAVVVGVPDDDAAGQDAGAAYVYRYSSGAWTERQVLTASDGAFEDTLGWSVAISGSTIVAGSPGDDTKAQDGGAVYAFGLGEPAEELEVVLVIDSSGSMTTNDPDNMRLQAAKLFVDLMEEQHGLGVVSFDSEALGIWPLSAIETFRLEIKDAVDTIDSSGGTNLSNGLLAAHDMLAQCASSNAKAVVFLTDGQGDYADEAVLFEDQGWPIYTVGLGDGVDAGLLQSIADETDGQYIQLSSAEDLQAVYFEIAVDLSGGETIGTFTSPIFEGDQLEFFVDVPTFFESFTVVSNWQGSDVVLTLVAPSGRVIDPSTTDPDVYHVKALTYELYRIDFPEIGTWTLQAYGAELPPQGEQLTISVAVMGASDDADGDGVLDLDDVCPNSSLDGTIVIDGCDSEVPNGLLEDGCSMLDLVSACADDAVVHGDFVSGVAQVTNAWMAQGLIAGAQKGRIQSCAAQSNLPGE